MKKNLAESERGYSAFYGSGWEDYLFSDNPVFSLESLREGHGGRGIGHLWDLPQEQVEAWYTEGWNDAAQEVTVQGHIPLLLDEVLEMMESGSEWYGSDFEKPIFVIRKVQAFLREKVEPRIRKYTDEWTGVSLTVIDDSPKHPMLNLVCPEHHILTFEEVNSAISRLLAMARLPAAALPLPFASSSSLPGEQP